MTSACIVLTATTVITIRTGIGSGIGVVCVNHATLDPESVARFALGASVAEH